MAVVSRAATVTWCEMQARDRLAVGAALASGGCPPPPAPRASWPSRRKKRRNNRGGDITPIRLRRRLRRQPRRERQGPPRPTRPGWLRSARRLQSAPACISHHLARRSACGSRNMNHGLYTSSTASKRNKVMAAVSRASAVRWGEMQASPSPPKCGSFERETLRPRVCFRSGCRARGAFVLSKRAARDARALPSDDLRPRRIEGASFSQIRCRNGRSVRPGCARDAQPETTSRTSAPAAQSIASLLTSAHYCPPFPGSFLLLACSRLRGIAR